MKELWKRGIGNQFGTRLVPKEVPTKKKKEAGETVFGKENTSGTTVTKRACGLEQLAWGVKKQTSLTDRKAAYASLGKNRWKKRQRGDICGAGGEPKLTGNQLGKFNPERMHEVRVMEWAAEGAEKECEGGEARLV